MEEITLKSNIENLDLLFLKIEEFLEDKGVSIKSKLKLELIIEELFAQYNSLALLTVPSPVLWIPVIAEKLEVSVVAPTSTLTPAVVE